MHPGMLNDLYKRAGVTSLGPEISKQARMKCILSLTGCRRRAQRESRPREPDGGRQSSLVSRVLSILSLE